MKRTFRSLLLVAVTAVMAAQAQATPVTYTFTGTKLVDAGDPTPDNTVSGTITLDPVASPDFTNDYPDQFGQEAYWSNGAFAINAITDTGYTIGTSEGGGTTTFRDVDFLSSFIESAIHWTAFDGITDRTVQFYSYDFETAGDGLAATLVPNPWTPLTVPNNYLLITEFNYDTGAYFYTVYVIESFEEALSSDTMPPVFASLTPSTATLWPPSHQMVPITLTAATSDNVGVVSTKIISATSSESDNGLGDGDTANDIQITGDLTLSLRAERSGNGNGRTYTIIVESVDAAGNTTQKTTTVSVPESHGK